MSDLPRAVLHRCIIVPKLSSTEPLGNKYFLQHVMIADNLDITVGSYLH